jgi:peptide/nickel transport system permease protein
MAVDIAPMPVGRPTGLAFVVGLSVPAAVAVLALVSLVWTPYGGVALPPLAEPSATHWLGSDAAGREAASVLMTATLGTLLLAALPSIASLMLGFPAGVALALWLGGAVRAPHVARTLPGAFVIGLLVSGLAAPGNLTITLAILIPGTIMVAAGTRAALAPLWQQDYVSAARIAGLSGVSAAQRHVLPELLPVIFALGLELLAAAILIELSLSFAGLGVLPPGLSLGLMLREAQQFAMVRPLLVIAPGGVALLAVFGLLLAASGLRRSP